MQPEPARFLDTGSVALLPPNATKLEKDLLGAYAPFDSVFVPTLEALASIDFRRPETVPDNWLPWLLVQFDLAKFAPFVEDQRKLLREGIELNLVKGTPAAIMAVCSWFGFNKARVWEEPEPTIHFSEFQVDLGEVPDDPRILCDLWQAIQHVKPARTRFRRVYHHYDKRQFILGQSMWGDLLSNYSGVKVDEHNLCAASKKTGLVASFGREQWLLPIRHPANAPKAAIRLIRERNLSMFATAHDRLWPVISDEHDGRFYPPYNTGDFGQGPSESVIVHTSKLGPVQGRHGWPILSGEPRGGEYLAAGSGDFAISGPEDATLVRTNRMGPAGLPEGWPALSDQDTGDFYDTTGAGAFAVERPEEEAP